MSHGHLFLASKRAAVSFAPDPDTGELHPTLAPGGTGKVVADQAGVLGVSWIASADTEGDRQVAAEHPDGLEVQLPSGGGVTIRLLRHDRETFAVVQDFVTAELLWAANNYGWDRWTTPTFTERTYTAMDHFAAFNADFSTALLDASDGVADPVYLVHDYQLLGVPALLRERRPDAPVLLFVHIPWPTPDYWRVLPAHVRTGLIESMLASTTIGFFTSRWVRNFVDCVADLLPDAKVDRDAGVVRWRGNRCRVRAMPLGYSPLTLRGRRPRLPEGVAEWVGDDPLVVHAGRTDPAKNAERAVRAFLRAVRSDERLDTAKMLVRMNPNRLYVAANSDYTRRVEEAVEEANRELGGDRVRVHCDGDIDHSIGCFQRADLLVFNSTVDGQNLSAFEAALVNTRDADLVLSEMCGAAELLAPVSRTVNPFDLVEQADMIRAGLTAPAGERAEAARRRREVAAPWTVEKWVRQQLDGLAEDHRDRHG